MIRYDLAGMLSHLKRQHQSIHIVCKRRFKAARGARRCACSLSAAKGRLGMQTSLYLNHPKYSHVA